jgi:hypothetical protein
MKLEPRWRCEECGAIDFEADIPEWPGPDGTPFQYCAVCGTADRFEQMCDEPARAADNSLKTSCSQRIVAK